MRIVGVNGSGRPNGNTAALVRAVLDAASERGAETDLLQLGALRVAGCNSCEACKATRACVIADDMQRFYDLAPEADVLVLGTPIYLDHVTAQTKAFLDRLYCYLGPDLENCYPRKDARVVLGITYGAAGEDTYSYVTEWMAERFRFYFGLETASVFTVHSTSLDAVVGPESPVMRKARAFGRTLAQVGAKTHP